MSQQIRANGCPALQVPHLAAAGVADLPLRAAVVDVRDVPLGAVADAVADVEPHVVGVAVVALRDHLLDRPAVNVGLEFLMSNDLSASASVSLACSRRIGRSCSRRAPGNVVVGRQSGTMQRI